MLNNLSASTSSTSTINISIKEKIKDKVNQATSTETTPEIILPKGAKINPSLIFEETNTSGEIIIPDFEE